MDSAWAIIPHGTPEVPCSRHLQPLVFGVDAGWSLPPQRRGWCSFSRFFSLLASATAFSCQSCVCFGPFSRAGGAHTGEGDPTINTHR
ncbi:uncharacterized protein CYBJADRAFT_17363 [Cyberlindnera jadinii NRRL Y-1542]|uniref:Uncharacterized protein n=1 Tax=Cyberlindnera jadinii (strain ATCC 18201 / CBS 1600 / BCRC 20928 / JCM 3617 / NBRC 0987 / NRRL Y-1542) TaxID=983966 RepID=A0A1E4RZ88_CYBJN|nr:hypothetical protein CYBJADRAFT_17363 [Cyberlindnera jadinii NRRL Y-1542]ODV72568.1 hypothetical protein CYBJADRAFT_17363 [Cyberlindnera jadinii NRRL Y-1542]